MNIYNDLSEESKNNLDIIFNMYGPIKCAALRNNNRIYEGKTHAECFLQEPKGILRNAEQGFITENNLFVDRKFGLMIAKYFNQIKIKHIPTDVLLSEDLLDIDVIK